MRIGVYSNELRDTDFVVAKTIIRLLSERGATVVCADNMIEQVDCKLMPKCSLAANCDILIVIGGDGTILSVAASAARYETPIFAINLGSLGFLTELEREDLLLADKYVDALLGGRFALDARTMLEVTYRDEKHLALNEVVLRSGNPTKIIGIDVRIDGEFVDSFRADGLLLSTPTGSTAYALSTGAPVLTPDMNGFILNSICSHSLTSKPLVFTDTKPVTLRLIRAEYPADVTLDSNYLGSLEQNETVTVKKATQKLKFIRIKDYNFYAKMAEKLKNRI